MAKLLRLLQGFQKPEAVEKQFINKCTTLKIDPILFLGMWMYTIHVELRQKFDIFILKLFQNSIITPDLE